MSCVEQGRWRHTSANFAVGIYAPPQMRNKKSRRVSASYKASGQAISDQGEVWQDVEQMVCSLNAHSATHAMKDAFDQRADDFGSFVKALPYPEGARGMLAAVSGRFVAMDALDRPEMFKCVWNRLVSGYAVDDVMVHISVFPNDPQSQRDEDGARHIMPPSFRRRPMHISRNNRC